MIPLEIEGEDFSDGPWRPAKDGRFKWTVTHLNHPGSTVELSFWRQRSAISMAHAMNRSFELGQWSKL